MVMNKIKYIQPLKKQPIKISTELFDVILHNDQQVTVEQILAIRNIILGDRLPQPNNIDRLLAITNEQWRKFAEKYDLGFEIDVNNQFSITKHGRYESYKLHAQFFPIRRDDIEQRRRVMDKLLFFKNILPEIISEFEYAQNIHDLIRELEGL